MRGHVTASRGKNPEMDKPSDTKHQRRPMKEPAEPHTASPSSLILPNPHLSDQTSRRNPLGLSPKALRNGGDVPRSHGYSNTRRVREASNDFLPSSRSIWDSQEKVSKSNNYSPAQSRIMDKNTVDTQKKGVRGVRSAPKSAGTSKPAQNNLVQFEVNMADFPELAGYPLGKAASLVPRTSASAWKSGRRESPTQRDLQQCSTDVKPDSPAVSPGQPVVTSWANVASQPPKKPVPHEKLTSNNHMQVEEIARQEDGDPAKKKRKKKKKKGKGAGGDAEAESEEPAVYQEPPKFEDEEEFPGLTPAASRVDRLISSSSAAKPCCEENQRAGGQHPSADENKDKSAAAKKAQKTEKASGKKSKVPVQLDIGNMLAVLEKKQQTQKAKQDAKPLVLSVGGGLPVVQKQPSVQKKPPWQQEKIAHNPLDSTSPMVKKGKQREVPKAKKPTPLKKVILKEREERKQRRLLEERGLLPDNEATPEEQDQPEAAEEEEKEEEEQCDTNITEEVVSPTEEPDVQKELTDTNQTVMDSDEEDDKEDVDKQQTTSPVSCPVSRPKIHSRKFRDYCTQMLSRDVDECVTKLLKELVRFQDRLYQKDPMKARMKRRIVMGLREVLKHLKLRKVKCVIISPNCERIQSKGGLDEALHNIIETCREQGVPFVFALSRKDLGHCVNKAVPVSLVGIFNYDGAQDYYHQMIELSTEARRAYDEMVSSLEESSQAEAQQAEEEQQISLPAVEAESGPDATYPEEAEYIRIWKTMLEKENNHVFLNFEKQLSSLCLDSEGTENTEDAKS